MIIRTARRAFQAKGFDYYAVVTDHLEIYKMARLHGLNAIMSPASCLTGSDRLFWAAQELGADYIVNCQGDEPLIDPIQIEKLLEFGLKNLGGWVTGHSYLDQNKSSDSDQVKIRVSETGRVGGFYRELIEPLNEAFFRHVGIYGYSLDTLRFFSQRPQSREELKLSLEQLRVWPDVDFYSVELDEPGLSVDTPADLLEIENILLDRA